jgi:hypothetical protein
MTVLGVLSVLLLMAKVATAWINAGDRFIDLWKKVGDFFDERKHLRRPRRQFELDNDLANHSDEARTLVFQVGNNLGFPDTECEALIAVAGNPIAALKFLVAAGKEGRKLAELQREGKLALPPPPTEQVTIRPSATAKQSARTRRKVSREDVRRGLRRKDDPH